jgi:hypothetical protein
MNQPEQLFCLQLPSSSRTETTLQGMGKTLTALGASVLIFGGVACIFTATEAAMEALRGHSDWKNGVVGGLAAGVLSRAGLCASNNHLLLSAFDLKVTMGALQQG